MPCDCTVHPQRATQDTLPPIDEEDEGDDDNMELFSHELDNDYPFHNSKRTISPATSFHEELARKTNKLSIKDDTSSQQSAAGSSGSDESAGTAHSILPGPQASASVPLAGIAPLGSVVPDSQDSAFQQRAFTPEDPNSMKSPIAINMITPAQQYTAGIDLQHPSPTTWAPSPIP
ncbi:hypothetical protein P691DRAFT_764515 [Macrolepiota fuliginosa MF-IS2]|uniref:Uncharacterized protein n=1 Tax=Macrolepiota fuliginosa MF-IS2 TaxID=1400762 RepID=A0A9P5X4E0_9AGAR|nr:hypothetical protein P691DRAFT_764515 [Macrolepiota fuliginosa MF-IS2]